MRLPHRTARPQEGLRLVKTWLPATVVRQMDETILSAGGAYNGRDEFISKAIADRIAEERMGPVKAAAPVSLMPGAPVERVQPSRTSRKSPADSQAVAFIVPKSTGALPTLPGRSINGALYGLHNRDYPTLWAGLSLLEMAA